MREDDEDPRDAFRRKTVTRLSRLSSRLKAMHDVGRSAQQPQQKRSAADVSGSIAILSLRASIFQTLKLLSTAAVATAPEGSSWERA